MGTRNLTAVLLDGDYRVAQYGQWDGYLSGQGAIIADFLRSIAAVGELERFKEQVRKCRFMSQAELDAAYKAYSDDGWMNMEQADAFKKSEFGHLSRDIGGGILRIIHESERDSIDLSNGLNFAADSLFCEYAYVVNLDENVLEIFEGFNKQPLEPQDRFYPLEDKAEDGYHPVKLLATLPINDRISEALEELIEQQNVADAAE